MALPPPALPALSSLIRRLLSLLDPHQFVSDFLPYWWDLTPKFPLIGHWSYAIIYNNIHHRIDAWLLFKQKVLYVGHRGIATLKTITKSMELIGSEHWSPQQSTCIHLPNIRVSDTLKSVSLSIGKSCFISWVIISFLPMHLLYTHYTKSAL